MNTHTHTHKKMEKFSMAVTPHRLHLNTSLPIELSTKEQKIYSHNAEG